MITRTSFFPLQIFYTANDKNDLSASVVSREKLLTVFSAAELLELHCLCREAGFIVHLHIWAVVSPDVVQA